MNKTLRFLLAIVFVFMTFSTPQPAYAAGLCYVNDDAAGNDDGTSWTDAYLSLQDALGDSCTEIWVAAGTYRPHASDRTFSFVLQTSTAIYGGFAGTETLLSERDYEANVSILSGDLNGDDSGFTNNGENSYHVVTSAGLTNTAVLDGFTVSGGNANGSSPDDSGGGVYNSSGSPSLSNVTFSGNFATSGGGGMYNITSSPTLTNVTFSANSSGNNGGGMYNTASSPTLTNVTFSANTSVGNGGGLYNHNSSPILTNLTFSGNSATINGGGVYNSIASPTLSSVTFSGNSANNGGGMYNTSSSPTLTNATFSGNSASIGGGGMYNVTSSSPKFVNVIIANSTSGGDCVNIGVSLNGTSSNNLIENGSSACGLTDGVNGDIIGSDPFLNVLADNGGATQTFSLQLSSLALNMGTNTGCPATDQRGVPRPQSVICDIGAYESNAQPGPTFVVNTNEDSDDGFCDAYIADLTDCTLREAINYANNISGTDTITFDANYTITLASELPNVISTIIINGNGVANTIIQADAALNTANYRIFFVNSGAANLTLNQMTVRHGVCDGGCDSAGGIGGGIYVVGGTLAVNNSLISANAASDGGAGLYNNFGTITITNSTFSDNSADNAGGAITNAGSITMSNSTVTNNTATGANFAGGIRNTGALNIYNSTIAGNTADSAVFDGANIVQESGTLNLYNTIIANGVNDGDCGFYGGTIGATNTLIESTGSFACNLTNGVNGNVIGSDPSLGTLTGSPAYFPLNSGSLAIDAGDDTICAAAPVNNASQNGAIRPQGSHCDIGSFEVIIFRLFLPLILR